MLQQDPVEHGTFYQGKCANRRAVIERRAHHRQVLAKGFQRLGIDAAFNRGQ